jgi:Co/Zn/Cd efflux system component
MQEHGPGAGRWQLRPTWLMWQSDVVRWYSRSPRLLSYYFAMDNCCEDKACAIDALRGRQSAILKAVLGINAVMFVVVLGAGLMASSTALLSDSLDNLGDALTYAVSLYAVSRGARTKARVALFKGSLILLAGLAVLGQVAYKLAFPVVPVFETMGVISLVALAANGLCLLLLTRHRHDDINMSSVWECSRNDIASNLAVGIAAIGVWLTGSGWPDLLIGFALAVLLLRSAARILRSAIVELRAAEVSESIAMPRPVTISRIAIQRKR